MSFKTVAMQATEGLSPLFKGRTAFDKKERKKLMDIPLTVQDFDIVDYRQKGQDKHYAIIVFEEYPDKTYGGGMKFTEIIDTGIAEMGSIEALRADYEKSYAAGDKLRVQMTELETADGNSFIDVEVIGDDV